MVLGRSLVGNVHTNDNDGVSLVLWDTSGDNEDININETLLKKMKDHNMTTDESSSLHSSMPSLDNSPYDKSGLKINDVKQANIIQNNKPLQQSDMTSATNQARNVTNNQDKETW